MSKDQLGPSKSLGQHIKQMEFGNGEYAMRLQMAYRELDEMFKACFWVRYQEAIKYFEITKDPRVAEWLMKWSVDFREQTQKAANDQTINEGKREQLLSKGRDGLARQQEIESNLKQIEKDRKEENELEKKIEGYDAKINELKSKLAEKTERLKELEGQHEAPVRRLSR